MPARCSDQHATVQVSALLNAAESIRSTCASVLGYKGAGTEQKLRDAHEKVQALQAQAHEHSATAEKLDEQIGQTQRKVDDLEGLSRCGAPLCGVLRPCMSCAQY